MSAYLESVSRTARQAVFKRNWSVVAACAGEILEVDNHSAEGYFLSGLVDKAAGRPGPAETALGRTLAIDSARYDAAIELAQLYCSQQRHGEAASLVAAHEPALVNSPLYLHMAGTVYATVGLLEKAWPLFRQANRLQPGVPLFESSLATCAVSLGKLDDAKRLYTRLVERSPEHQRYHYQLARISRATDRAHVDRMIEIAQKQAQPGRNVFLYYAIGKELEDLEAWDEAFAYFRKAGDAVVSVADYEPDTDLDLMDTIVEVFDEAWIRAHSLPAGAIDAPSAPLFIVGLPRTGTTLIERIVSSHSSIESVGETQYLQMAVKDASRITSDDKMNAAIVAAAAEKDIAGIARSYLDRLRFRLGDSPAFVDKLPFNIFYLGFIAAALPQARMIYVHRDPMDACFAMYKQVFTGAYKFSYSLDTLGQFYIAFDRLVGHWRRVLGDRLVEIRYEALVADQEQETRRLLDKLDLDFEEACLRFDRNAAASATASSVQVREPVHNRSVGRWQRYRDGLEPLRQELEAAGIAVPPTDRA